MNLKALMTVTAAVASIGCASLTREHTQNIGLMAPGCKEPVQCSLTNKKGTWQGEAPGMVAVRRSDDPLRLACKMGDEHWQGEIEGQRGGRAWGNVILGGGVGAIVDANTDAHWDYPASITVPICTGRG